MWMAIAKVLKLPQIVGSTVDVVNQLVIVTEQKSQIKHLSDAGTSGKLGNLEAV